MYLFSIITVCYNSEQTIEETFLSVLRQEFRDFEYIVVDGASSDGTINIIKKYSELFNKRGICFRWVSEKDQGIYDAMNKGIDMADGRYIALLNSDDTYESDTMQNVDAAIKVKPGFDVYHGLLRFVKGKQLQWIIGTDICCLDKHMIEHPTCFISKEAYNKFGLYDCKYKLAADYDLIIRMKNGGASFCFIEEILANYSVEGSSISDVSKLETLAIKKKYGYISLINYIYRCLKIRLKSIFKSILQFF